MPASSDATNRTASSAAAPRCWFYGVAVILMLVGVTAAFVQKVREGAVGVSVARKIASGVQETNEHKSAVQRIIRDAERWAILSLAAVVSAIVSWGVALRRHEKQRGTWVILVSLFALYVGLELIMV